MSEMEPGLKIPLKAAGGIGGKWQEIMDTAKITDSKREREISRVTGTSQCRRATQRGREGDEMLDRARMMAQRPDL